MVVGHKRGIKPFEMVLMLSQINRDTFISECPFSSSLIFHFHLTLREDARNLTHKLQSAVNIQVEKKNHDCSCFLMKASHRRS